MFIAHTYDLFVLQQGVATDCHVPDSAALYCTALRGAAIRSAAYV